MVSSDERFMIILREELERKSHHQSKEYCIISDNTNLSPYGRLQETGGEGYTN
jgi:hypothetical protein